MRIPRFRTCVLSLLGLMVLAAGPAGVVDLSTPLPVPLALVRRTILAHFGDRLSIWDFGAACSGTTDDSLAVSNAAAAIKGTNRLILVPANCTIDMGSAARLAGKTPYFDHAGLIGEGGRDMGAETGVDGYAGSTFLLTDTGGPAFIANNNASFRQLTFFWPGNTEAAATANNGTPPTFPALIAGGGTAAGAPVAGDEVVGLRFDDNQVVNATTVIDAHLDTSGAFEIAHNLAFFTGPFLNLGTMPSESFIHDNRFTPAAYGAILSGPTYNLWNYAALHGEVVRATGGSGSTPNNATSGTGAPVANTNPTWGSNQGLNIHHNYVFGIGYFLRAVGGWFDLLDASDNQLDGVPHAVSVETGGAIDGRFDGGAINGAADQNAGNAPSAATTAVFYWAAGSAPGALLSIDHTTISTSTGAALDVENVSNPLAILVTNPSWNSLAVATGQDAIVWKAPSRPQFQGGTISMAGSSSAVNSCFNLAGNTQSLMLQNIMFVSCGNVISFTGGTSGGGGSGMISGNVSVGTRTAIYGGTFPQYAAAIAGINSWDLPTPYAQLAARTDGAITVKAGGSVVASVTEAGALNLKSTANQSVSSP